MIKWIVKKWLLSSLNEMLHSIDGNEKAVYWKNKVKAVTMFLLDVQDSIEDNKLSDEEIEKLLDKCKSLFGEQGAAK